MAYSANLSHKAKKKMKKGEEKMCKLKARDRLISELELWENMLVVETGLLYDIDLNTTYDIMFDAVSKGKLTFQTLSNVLKKIHFAGMTKGDMSDACNLCKKLSLTEMNIMNMKTVITIRKAILGKYST